MKKSIAVICALAMITVMMPFAYASSTFTDVSSSSEFAAYIEHLAGEGIVSGSGGLYYPNNNLTRGEMVKIAVLSAEIPLNTTGGQKFSDVPSSNGFYQYIQTAANANIVSGFNDGTFRPNLPVTRGGSTKIIINAFNYGENLSGAPHFTDVPASHTFYKFIETSYNRGLIGGYGNGKFGPDDYINRAQMAKIVSRSLGGPGATPSEVGDIVLNYSFTGMPSGTATIFTTTPNKVSLNLNNLQILEGDFMYQAWLRVDGSYEKLGQQFNMNEDGEAANSSGARITNEFAAESDVPDGTEVIVTIEDENDDSPAPTTVLKGAVDNDETVYLYFPVDFPSDDGVMKTDGKDVQYLFNDLPSLNAIGFQYQGWFVIDDRFISTGTFQGSGSGVTMDEFTYMEIPGADIERVVISIEPQPDTDADPFQMRPFMSDMNPFAEEGDEDDDEDDETNDIPSVGDYDVYDGLTTDQTSMSIIVRTEMEVDEAEGVIVQAYAASPVVPDQGDNTIVIKISDLEGNPISDLDLLATQLSGAQGELDDPEEVADGTGVYIANFTADTSSGLSTSSEEVIIMVYQDSIDEEDVAVPEIEVTFTQTRSAIVGTPKLMELDIPEDALVYDENLDSDDLQDDLLILTTVLDSRKVSVPGLDGEMNLFSVSGSALDASPNEEGGIYIFEVSVDDIIDDDANTTVTYSSKAQVQLIATGGGVFVPIISDQFEITVQFIPEEV